MYVVSYTNNGKEKVYPKPALNYDEAKKIIEQLYIHPENENAIIDRHPLADNNETYLVTYETSSEIHFNEEILSRDEVAKVFREKENSESVKGISISEFGNARRNTDSIGNIVSWFKEATPSPTPKNISTQIGCNFEEMHEFSERISLTNPDAIEDGEIASEILAKAREYLHKLANLCKNQEIAYIDPEDRLEALDAICDINVTGTGVGVYYGMDVVGAQKEVNRSNFSKFDENGKAIRNENQKIIKGPNYSKPNLKPFI